MKHTKNIVIVTAAALLIGGSIAHKVHQHNAMADRQGEQATKNKAALDALRPINERIFVETVTGWEYDGPTYDSTDDLTGTTFTPIDTNDLQGILITN